MYQQMKLGTFFLICLLHIQKGTVSFRFFLRCFHVPKRLVWWEIFCEEEDFRFTLTLGFLTKRWRDKLARNAPEWYVAPMFSVFRKAHIEAAILTSFKSKEKPSLIKFLEMWLQCWIYTYINNSLHYFELWIEPPFKPCWGSAVLPSGDFDEKAVAERVCDLNRFPWRRISKRRGSFSISMGVWNDHIWSITGRHHLPSRFRSKSFCERYGRFHMLLVIYRSTDQQRSTAH